jgi:hypothetical protein
VAEETTELVGSNQIEGVGVDIWQIVNVLQEILDARMFPPSHLTSSHFRIGTGLGATPDYQIIAAKKSGHGIFYFIKSKN